ncbi:dihydrolipoyl dehydrogenase [Acinetobacter rudis]|uniref:Dihydrolipoyl dehydrogenase n=1 Tax=Acinetobacter rudis TaxID=632955 RepID=A0AAW8J7K2_9GAMM|nr:dihydrolipoyl dehydrogenase [Acinetobacter rudis]MDQ8936042.1 dihydrolipoyl dehydrogenase [Acinetobacter rudis]MDQ9018305.1 dihydrolipoyl dehydrogenase [Acinetobacter rudis]
MSKQQFDLVVVGGGPGGYVAAIRASQLGMKTAVVERAELGGICLNWGCLPTKALLRSADVLRLVKNADVFGIDVAQPKIKLDKVVQRSRDVSAKLQRGVAGLLKKNKVTVFQGEAKLLGQGQLSVQGKSTETLTAKHIILATGARARAIENMPVDGQHFWSYREALLPKAIPKRMVVIGAGAIGIEFACFYRAMGAEVTVVEMAERILVQEDAEISTTVSKSLQKDGIQIYTDAKVASHQLKNGEVVLNIEAKQPVQLIADVVLLAVGISANTENLGLEQTKIELNRGHIVTDEYCRTSEKNIYAIGDVAGPPWLAHKASHEGVLCVEKIMGLDVHPLDRNKVPACTYSHPQVASVGYSEKQAQALGKKIRVGKFPFVANGKALAMESSEGFVKVVFDEQSGELLGAHMVGEEVTEMINGYAIAQTLETTEQELMQTILPHPTMSEAMHEAVLAAYQRALHQ